LHFGDTLYLHDAHGAILDHLSRLLSLLCPHPILRCFRGSATEAEGSQSTVTAGYHWKGLGSRLPNDIFRLGNKDNRQRWLA
jgi:hypothetical protein